VTGSTSAPQPTTGRSARVARPHRDGGSRPGGRVTGERCRCGSTRLRRGGAPVGQQVVGYALLIAYWSNEFGGEVRAASTSDSSRFYRNTFVAPGAGVCAVATTDGRAAERGAPRPSSTPGGPRPCGRSAMRCTPKTSAVDLATAVIGPRRSVRAQHERNRSTPLRSSSAHPGHPIGCVTARFPSTYLRPNWQVCHRTASGTFMLHPHDSTAPAPRTTRARSRVRRAAPQPGAQQGRAPDLVAGRPLG
jgi:hypothetical protein